MKNKSRLCSTGHGTGAVYVRGLHEVLAADKDRRIRKKLARINRRKTATARRSNWLLKMARKLGLKPAPKPAAPAPVDITQPIAAATRW